jgi:hypothetical protein
MLPLLLLRLRATLDLIEPKLKLRGLESEAFQTLIYFCLLLGCSLKKLSDLGFVSSFYIPIYIFSF